MKETLSGKTFFLFLLKTGRKEYEGKMLEKTNILLFFSTLLISTRNRKDYSYAILKLTLKRISVHIAFP